MHTQSPRTYFPKPGEIVYHYCSPETFNLICSTKRLRWGSIFNMNDSMELEWGIARRDEVYNELVKKESFGDMPAAFLDSVSYGHAKAIQKMGTLAVCFSRKADSLSQFRAYASDGYGFAIGFDASEMLQHPEYGEGFGTHSALEVLYNVSEQKSEIEEELLRLYSSFLNDIDERTINYYLNCETLANNLLAYKNPAFEDEAEIRFIEKLQVNSLEMSFSSWDIEERIHFLFSPTGTPKLYVDNAFSPAFVKRVIIGPKNTSTDEQIEVYLNTLGFQFVEITRSGASYR